MIEMSQISISNLTFCYEGSYDNIFENVSFQIDTDWKLGFIGRNGRGKTTFLKLLMGEYAYSGSISSGMNYEYFPFNVPDPSQNTADLLRAVGADVQEWEILRELSLLEVSEDILYRPFETLSNGERTKALLAALFLKENRFLLIDEPTNHLDLHGRRTVSRYLNTKKGFILVSHDRAFLDNCVDHVLSINRSNIEVQKGNFSTWWKNKQLQDQYELSENERLKKDIKRLSDAAKQAAQWSDKAEKSKIKKNSDPGSGSGVLDRGYVGHKAAKMMKRAKAIEKRQHNAIKEKSTLLKNAEKADSLKLSSLTHHAGRLIELDGVSIHYGTKQVCSDIGFTVRQGDIIALRGKNGSGKSSVLKLICGEDIGYTGSFYKAPNLVISYVPQETSFLSGSLTQFAEEAGIDETLFKAILRKLDFSRVQFEKDMSAFSGGQKKKVLIARSLCERAHLYIWDEPLNYIDVLSRMQIEELLLSYRPAMLFVEHDSTFCEKIATRTIELR
jgi:lincosamide and streptogramin A transport system ATP-binding/permease protein